MEFYLQMATYLVIMTLWFFPTYIGVKRNYRGIGWIFLFNLICFPVAWLLAATGTPKCECR